MALAPSGDEGDCGVGGGARVVSEAGVIEALCGDWPAPTIDTGDEAVAVAVAVAAAAACAAGERPGSGTCVGSELIEKVELGGEGTEAAAEAGATMGTAAVAGCMWDGAAGDTERAAAGAFGRAGGTALAARIEFRPDTDTDTEAGGVAAAAPADLALLAPEAAAGAAAGVPAASGACGAAGDAVADREDGVAAAG